MDIDMKDTLTLSDDKEYVVVSTSVFDNNKYYYLIDINDTNNVMFCLENKENQSLIEISNPNLIQTLLPLFLQNSKDIIAE